MDNSLTHGLNIYRVKIELLDGRIVYSEDVTVFFAKEPYIIYPNPVRQDQPVTLVSEDPDVIEVQLFNTVGERVFEKSVNDFANSIPTVKLSKGVYVLRIIKGNQLQKTLKLIVY